jgi:transcriptional regulator with XRE-family HTH domain
MGNRVRILDQAVREMRRVLIDIGLELRDARLALGLSQLAVAHALGWSGSKVGRIERGEDRSVKVLDLVRFGSVVGRRPWIKLFPAAGRLRDAAQLRLEESFLAAVKPGGWAVAVEDPLPLVGDLRAFDIVLRRTVSIGTEIISRLHDAQAQLRPIMLKQRDAAIDRVVIVAKDSAVNRQAVREAEAVLASAFPCRGRGLMTALRAGRDPGGNGLLFLR